MSEDDPLLRDLRTRVEIEVAQYVYTAHPAAVGTPWSAEQVASALSEMREALISPYWTTVELHDTIQQISLEQPLMRRCIVVADDRQGYLLVWDPIDEEFMLAHLCDSLPCSFNIRGDAVGCFPCPIDFIESYLLAYSNVEDIGFGSRGLCVPPRDY
jgi:hypothetical protein